MKSKKILPLEHWIGYRFSRISARFGNLCRADVCQPPRSDDAGLAQSRGDCQDQPLTATQLAHLTSSDPSKVARAIELLVRRGLIRRGVDRTDRRRASLGLTREGRKVYREIEKFSVRVEREITNRLSATELAGLRRLLDKLDHRIEDQVRSRSWKEFFDN